MNRSKKKKRISQTSDDISNGGLRIGFGLFDKAGNEAAGAAMLEHVTIEDSGDRNERY